jgi:hypothetical protein
MHSLNYLYSKRFKIYTRRRYSRALIVKCVDANLFEPLIGKLLFENPHFSPLDIENIPGFWSSTRKIGNCIKHHGVVLPRTIPLSQTSPQTSSYRLAFNKHIRPSASSWQSERNQFDEEVLTLPEKSSLSALLIASASLFDTSPDYVAPVCVCAPQPFTPFPYSIFEGMLIVKLLHMCVITMPY